ncbi:nucleoside triphosphate pyrophosphatase [Sphingomonas sp.]|uniref:Maf family protein n=1 Tax=Sphingomonas sp. TaxID=28214 RepID=UPI0025D56FE0|nr:nucleoside triphosphate pyrophosphatase [Sphingomonas sp.]
MTLVLASMSAARRGMLAAAGVPFEAVASGVDENSVKASLKADGVDARDLADALAELKALRISRRRPGDIVLGCDQTLSLDDGTMLDKPGRLLSEQLHLLSGKTHTLYSAVVAVENGTPIWRNLQKAKLTMRRLSDTFIADYVEQEGEQVRDCVGGYRIEGLGAQLFTKIEGSHFVILGLPLLSLLDWLRLRGIMAS